MKGLPGHVLLLWVAGHALATPEPRVRVAIEGTQPVLVGQQVRIDGDPSAWLLAATVSTVRVHASPILMIPPPTFAAPNGVRVYPRDPVLSDVTTERGCVGGRRVDRAIYVFEQPGEFTLPAIEIGWFNAETGKQETARAPQVVVSVVQVAAGGSELSPPTPTQQSPAGGSGVPACALALFAALVAFAAW